MDREQSQVLVPAQSEWSHRSLEVGPVMTARWGGRIGGSAIATSAPASLLPSSGGGGGGGAWLAVRTGDGTHRNPAGSAPLAALH